MPDIVLHSATMTLTMNQMPLRFSLETMR